MLSRKTGLWIMAGVTLAIAVIDCCLHRIPQPLWYHNFADHRGLWGIPNFGDVVSNLPFAIIGIWGLAYLLRLKDSEIAERFLDRRERWPYLLVFVGLFLTAFGSAYYHWHPDNSTLLWDRLPLVIDFMSLVAAMFIERISVRVGFWMFPVFLLVGISSVLEWDWSESCGAGDLRFYAAVQVYSVVFLVLCLLLPPRYTGSKFLVYVAGFYVLAKVLETYDKVILAWLGGAISGHTLKHLAAAISGYWILRMLKERRAIESVK